MEERLILETNTRGRTAAGNTNCLVQQGKHGPLVRLMDGQTTTSNTYRIRNRRPASPDNPFIHPLIKDASLHISGPHRVGPSVCLRCLKPCRSLAIDGYSSQWLFGVPENSSFFH